MTDTRVPMWRTVPQQQHQQGPDQTGGTGPGTGEGQQGGQQTPPNPAPNAGTAPGGKTGDAAGQTGQQQTGQAGSSGDGEDRSPADAPTDRGFPVDTPVSAMKPVEAAAYWKWQARKYQDFAGGPRPGELAELRKFKEDADRAALSETDRKIADARREGETTATTRALTTATAAMYKSGLVARGVEDAQVDALVRGFNPIAYLTGEGDKLDIDVDGVSQLAALHARPGTGQQQRNGWPDMGQGHRQSTAPSGRDAGRAEAQRRYPKTARSAGN